MHKFLYRHKVVTSKAVEEEFMSDTTQRLRTNQISFVFCAYFVWFPLHGGCE